MGRIFKIADTGSGFSCTRSNSDFSANMASVCQPPGQNIQQTSVAPTVDAPTLSALQP